MALRRGLSEDPFDALLNTARGIGFSIPEWRPTLDDIQFNAFINNLLQLIQTGGRIPEIEAMLRTVECNGSVHGLLDVEMLEAYIEKLKRASAFFTGFSNYKGALLERLTGDDIRSGIPVELRHQQSFCHLIDAIARDKFVRSFGLPVDALPVDRYKLFELVTEAKACVASNASPIDWRSQLDVLRGIQEQLKTANRHLDELSQTIARHTQSARPRSPISQSQYSRDIIMKD